MTTSIVETEPHAAQVFVTDDELVVHLVDGRKVSVPLAWYPRLLHASTDERNEWELIQMYIGVRSRHPRSPVLFVASSLEPLVTSLAAAAGTMAIAAGVPEDVFVAAAITEIAMTAESRSAAIGNGAHHLELGGRSGVAGEKLAALGADDCAE